MRLKTTTESCLQGVAIEGKKQHSHRQSKKPRRKAAFSKDCNPALYTEGLEELGAPSGQCNALSQTLAEQVWGQLGLHAGTWETAPALEKQQESLCTLPNQPGDNPSRVQTSLTPKEQTPRCGIPSPQRPTSPGIAPGITHCRDTPRL